MAELLFKAVDATNPNPTKDARGCYKRGDLVDIREDGWSWGNLELKAPASGGKFVVIKITSIGGAGGDAANPVTRQMVLNFIANKWNCDWFSTWVSGQDIIGRRRLSVDWTALPAGVLSTLNNTGQYSNTWSAIRQYFKDKLTDTNATGDPI